MPSVTLDKTYIFNGKFYGPGVAEVPDDFPPEKTVEGQQPKPKGGRRTQQPTKTEGEGGEQGATEFKGQE